MNPVIATTLLVAMVASLSMGLLATSQDALSQLQARPVDTYAYGTVHANEPMRFMLARDGPFPAGAVHIHVVSATRIQDLETMNPWVAGDPLLIDCHASGYHAVTITIHRTVVFDGRLDCHVALVTDAPGDAPGDMADEGPPLSPRSGPSCMHGRICLTE